MKLILNQRGQFAIEGVLLMIIFVGLFLTATRYIQDEKILAQLVQAPWLQVQGMAECGVWGPPSKVCKSHPNNLDRNLTLRPRN